MRPLDYAALGVRAPWTSRPLDNASLGRRVPDRCLLTLNRIEVLVVTCHFDSTQYISVLYARFYSPTLPKPAKGQSVTMFVV